MKEAGEGRGGEGVCLEVAQTTAVNIFVYMRPCQEWGGCTGEGRSGRQRGVERVGGMGGVLISFSQMDGGRGSGSLGCSTRVRQEQPPWWSGEGQHQITSSMGDRAKGRGCGLRGLVCRPCQPCLHCRTYGGDGPGRAGGLQPL